MHPIRQTDPCKMQGSGFPCFLLRDVFDDNKPLHYILQRRLLPEQIELLKDHRRTLPQLQHIRFTFLGEIDLQLVQPDRSLIRYFKQIDGPKQGGFAGAR
ncbi:hypothetical protein D3C81_1975480 [compost metagenome]